LDSFNKGLIQLKQNPTQEKEKTVSKLLRYFFGCSLKPMRATIYGLIKGKEIVIIGCA